MKSPIRILLLSAVATLAVGLNQSHALNYTLSGTLDPLQAGTNGDFGEFDDSIAGAGDGTGTITGDYDDETKLLNYTITWEGLTSDISNMHFHVAPAGEPGGVDLGIPEPWVSPQMGSNIALTDNADNLLAGDWYVNIHTDNFGGGEIRGQVIVTLVPEPSTGCLAGLALLSIVTQARRRRR